MYNREISFDGRKVDVSFEEEELIELLDFLFLDLVDDDTIESFQSLKISRDEEKDQWTLLNGEKSLYSGASLPGLGTILMGEVLFHLIRENDHALAIHAGLVSRGERTILLPGSSGSGKSSVTTWLVSHGWRYHTDELVAIDLVTRAVKAFTRPLNIKTRGVPAVREIFDLDSVEDQCQISAGVTMIPHRLVNSDFSANVPHITHVIFPKYIAESEPELIELSGAEAGLEMMRSNVIARNLPNHGFSQITALVRDIPAYRLHYQHFDNLPDLIKKIA